MVVFSINSDPDANLSYIVQAAAALPMVPQPINPNSTSSGYLFIGGNSSFQRELSGETQPYKLNLDGLPVTTPPLGLFFTLSRQTTNGVPDTLCAIAPQATVLFCEPNMQITNGRVKLIGNSTLTVITSGRPPLGEITREAATILLSISLFNAALDPEKVIGRDFVNPMMSAIFLGDDSRFLDINQINENVDGFIQSASKAWVDGYRSQTSNPSNVTFASQPVDAQMDVDQIALTASNFVLIVTTILVVFAAALLLALSISELRHPERVPFDLQHLLNTFNILQAQVDKRKLA